MATNEELATKIRAKIDAVLDADPATMKYKIGSKSVDKTAYLSELRNTLKMLQESPADVDIEWFAFDDQVTEFGEDETERVL